jgi:hypothetical protein
MMVFAEKPPYDPASPTRPPATRLKGGLMPLFRPLSALFACAAFLLLPSLVSTPTAAPPPPPPATWKLLAWNDLGMHCMDSDFSVFSILQPFNDLRAQAIDASGHLVGALPAGYTVQYEAVADPSGSINATSAWKTNYWTHANALFGAAAAPDTGLAGHNMPGPANTPQPMALDAVRKLFGADGVPITPYDDAGRKRYYPLMKAAVRDAAGVVKASASAVLPVSDELDCRACHASGGPAAAAPVQGAVFDASSDRDYRLNILKKHDERLGQPAYDAALAAGGFSAAGLYAQVSGGGAPVLCAKCHASNALPGTGLAGVSPLTQAIHLGHADVLDPLNGQTLGASTNRSSCYRCHPGSETKCLRGAMGSAVAADGSLAIQCQNCHGGMAAVGTPGRVGWLDQPSCQNCHTGTATANSGQIRYTDAYSAPGVRRQPADGTFATQPNQPQAPFELYRFSAGHGGLSCEACHGSTHAEYPATHGNDNLQPQAFQGHAGTIVECSACHATRPDTILGGPHGMHPIDQKWVNDHHDDIDQVGVAQCRKCHGADDKGTVLSVAQADRTFSHDGRTYTIFRGEKVGCFKCHDGLDTDDPPSNQRPVATNLATATVDQPIAVTLAATDPENNALTYRIVAQPAHGRVALAGAVATYLPDPGFAGVDVFTYCAADAKGDSNRATVSVTRGATWSNYDVGYPGTGGVVPALFFDARPVQGATIVMHGGNPTGVAGAPALLIVGVETLTASTPFGGRLLVLPDFLLPLSLTATGVDLPWTVPTDPAFVGFTLHAQLAVQDAGAAHGVAFSRGLRAVLGG